MELKLYDTLTREKRVFRPIDPARVRMYVCGPTVYDYAHIGNARPVIVFDVLFRLLRHLYGTDRVTYVRNITDVDDKINARAAERGISIRDLTEETYANFKADVTALGCLPPTVEPRATEHIEEMKALIERLVAGGHAYLADDHVLFSVPSMRDYGKLSNRSLDEMIAGARVEVAPYKKDATDFVLWKPSKEGEPAWPSPCGIKVPGRPGWHIECSAMADKWLWTEAQKDLSESGLSHPHQFDIHGGGIDLVFPHHENEIAQSRCAFHTGVMANYWMHNGFLQVEGEKMSKSLGNFVTIHELLRGWKGQPWSGSTVRWTMLQTHYRQPIDWTFDNLIAARNELAQFFIYYRNLDHAFSQSGKNVVSEAANNFQPSSEVIGALTDDLNTPAALGYFRSLKSRLSQNRDVVMQSLRDLMFLGVVSDSTRYTFSMSATGDGWPVGSAAFVGGLSFNLRIARANGDKAFADQIIAEAAKNGFVIEERGPLSLNIRFTGASTGANSTIESLIAQRDAARKAKDFKESDRIRNELAAMGVELKDSKEGTTWNLHMRAEPARFDVTGQDIDPKPNAAKKS